MIILVTGSRDCVGFEPFIISMLNCKIWAEDCVITGGAIGTDSVAESWCRINGIPCKKILPIRKDLGSYYLHRNAEMIAVCDKVITFWDGKSRGTKFVIDYAKARGKDVEIYGLNIENYPQSPHPQIPKAVQ